MTEEELKPNAAKIPNVCDHFMVGCRNVEGFLNYYGQRNSSGCGNIVGASPARP